MKILYVHNAYRVPGGEDLCVEKEVHALKKAGLTVETFLVPPASTLHALADAVRAPFQGGTMSRLKSAIQAFAPDIIHAHNLFPSLSPNLFPEAKRMGSVTVQTLHNFRPLCLNGLYLTPHLEVCERCSLGSYMPGVLRGCYRGSRPQSIGMAAHLAAAARQGWYDKVDFFIAPSQFLKAKFERSSLFQNKIIHQAHFLPEEVMPEPAPAEPYALYLGRLSEEKGVSWLLERFSTHHFPLKLVIAGDGPLRRQVQASESDTIEYRGYVQGNEKVELIRKAAVLLLPSECYENAPLALLEANSYGVPVLAADHGGLREHIRPGVNGDTYPLHEERAFAKMLLRFTPKSTNLEDRKTCQAYAQSTFSEKRFIEERKALYERACTQNSRRL